MRPWQMAQGAAPYAMVLHPATRWDCGAAGPLDEDPEVRAIGAFAITISLRVMKALE
jgi:hypothetical protein